MAECARTRCLAVAGAASPAQAAHRCRPKPHEDVRAGNRIVVVLERSGGHTESCVRATGLRRVLVTGTDIEQDSFQSLDRVRVKGRFVIYTWSDEYAAAHVTYSSLRDAIGGDGVSLGFFDVGGTLLARIRLRRDGRLAFGVSDRNPAYGGRGRIVVCRFPDCGDDHIVADGPKVDPGTVRLGRRACWREGGRRECERLPPRGPGRRCRPAASERVVGLYPEFAVLGGRNRPRVTCLRRTGQRWELVPAGTDLLRVVRVDGPRMVFAADPPDGIAYDVFFDAGDGGRVRFADEPYYYSTALGSIGLSDDGALAAGIDLDPDSVDSDARILTCRIPTCSTVAEGADIEYRSVFLDRDQACWQRHREGEGSIVECAPVPAAAQ